MKILADDSFSGIFQFFNLLFFDIFGFLFSMSDEYILWDGIVKGVVKPSKTLESI
jgi:hypothetical protein